VPAPVIPINALFGKGFGPNLSTPLDSRQELRDADVILGMDVMSRSVFLIYGQDVLEDLARTGEARHLRVLRIGLDQETEELERLVALVETVKGRHDYRGGEQ
jgi:hypothetical protein